MNYDSNLNISGKKVSGTITGSDVGMVIDDISEEAHTYSLVKESIGSENPKKDDPKIFNTNTFKLEKSGTKHRVETVIRPFKGTMPPPLQYSRDGEIIRLRLDDGTNVSISTAERQVKMNI
jgi:hypothetical protein